MKGRMHLDIALLLFENFSALDAISPYEALVHLPGVNLQLVAKTPGQIQVDTGMWESVAAIQFGSVPSPDVLILPGGPGTPTVLQDQETLSWVRNAHASAQRTFTICSGSLILAATGALQGLDATTTWFNREHLAAFGANYIAKPYVQQGKIIMAAGSPATDATLVLIHQLFGEEYAQAAQLMLEYDPQPPFDTGSITRASPQLMDFVMSKIFEPEGARLQERLEQKRRKERHE